MVVVGSVAIIFIVAKRGPSNLTVGNGKTKGSSLHKYQKSQKAKP